MLANLTVKIAADISSLTGQLKKAQGQLSNFSDQTARVGRGLTAGVSTPLALLGIRAVKTASEFEDLRTSFEVLTGSAKQGAEIFEELRKFSASTPFETKDLANATKTMLSFGISVDDSADFLRMLGDVSLGNSEKLKGLTLAFAQVQSAGKLMGQDLLQMINQGFNPLQPLAEKTGKSIGELKEEMSKGAISAEDVAESFRIATSQGGQFFGGMEKGSKTLSGVFSTFQDNVTSALGELGEELVKTFDLKKLVKDATEKLQDFTKAFKNLSDQTKRRILGIATILGAGGPLLLAISAITKVFAMLNIKILLIVGVLALIGYSAQVLADNFDTLKKRTLFAFKYMTFAITDFLDSFINMESVLSFLGKTFGNAMLTGLGAVAGGFAGLANNIRATRDQAEVDLNGMLNTGLGTFTSFSDSANNFKNNIKQGLGSAFDFLLTEVMGFNDTAEETVETLEKVEESGDGATQSISKFKKLIEALKPSLQQLTTAFISASLDGFTQSLFNAGKYNTKELELRRLNLNQQKDALKQSLNEQAISQEEYSLRVALLNQELLDTETAINEERKNNFQKAMSAMIDSAGQAVREILAEFAKLAVIKGLLALLGGATGGVGGFFKESLEGMIGGKAVGGPVFGKTPYIVGERGPELFVPNRSGSIMPNNELMGKSTTMGTSDIRLGGEFRIKGTDLVLAINEANYKLGR